MECRIYGQNANEVLGKYDLMYTRAIRSGSFTPSELQTVKKFISVCIAEEINNDVRVENI